MLSPISAYIKSIVFFMIFMSLVNLIIPGEKYRGNINIVLGLILVFIIASPLLRLISGDNAWLDGVLASVSNIEDQANIQNQPSAADQARQAQIMQNQRALIKQAFEQQARAQVSRIAQDNGAVLVSLSVTEDTERQSGDFTVKGMDVTVKAGNRQQTDKIKNDISNFYNLAAENIHIQSHY